MHLTLNRKLALSVVAALTFSGAALAQSATPTAPSKTPNDSTAAQPNRPLPQGTQAPAPGTPNHRDGMQHNNKSTTDKHDGMRKNDGTSSTTAPNAAAPRDRNTPNSPGSNYPNTGGSK
ncbi:hypothetical protein [Bordetella genomosp. 1]|uniref:Uncharacterized protein n=1 Tax=Bordetella genomosp. 1 TaxID=1395607 RepID=A0ABX4EXF3_9BORD|nr:hypothetical protein [Bordetella genomosp. 1]MDQ8034055.1 hypothetical protein [Bordetella sp.]OZI63771.1 hypothetical protein CAL27_14275 [Bordetella genomosp. 1]